MDKKLNIALVQAPLLWEDPKRNRSYFAKKLEEIISAVDLIIFPEMFNTGFTMHPEHIDKNEGEITLEWMQEKAKAKNVALIGSIPFFENNKYTNRLFFVKPDGSHQHYDKRHTFTLAGENEVYEAGEERLIVEFKGFRICPLICYDLRFPVWARNSDDYDILIYVANWPKPRITAWDTLLKARAIENMAYCIGVNRIGADELGYEYPGHSGVYDVLGDQLAFSQKEETVYATLSKAHITSTRKKLKFLDDRDTFSLIS